MFVNQIMKYYSYLRITKSLSHFKHDISIQIMDIIINNK